MQHVSRDTPKRVAATLVGAAFAAEREKSGRSASYNRRPIKISPSILRPPEVLTEAELATAEAELKALQRHAFEMVDPEIG